MSPFLRAVPAVLSGALLCGCAASGVRVAYPQPQTPQGRELSRSLGNLYLVVGRPPLLSGSLIGGALSKAQDIVGQGARISFGVDAGHFARALGKTLDSRGAHLIAYRAMPSSVAGPDPFLERLRPSGILRVDFTRLHTAIKEESTETQVKNKEGKYEKRTTTQWKLTAHLTLRTRLVVHPGGGVLHESTHTVTGADTSYKTSQKKPSADEWYRKIEGQVLSRAAQEIAKGLGRTPVIERKRMINADKEEPLSAAARSAAFAGDWERASELWAERLESGKGGWRDLMNLAVAAEKRREFAEADRLYRKAQESAAGDPAAGEINWQSILEELAGALDAVGRRSQAAIEWFAAPTAVMPFSDVTLSVEGPDILRELMHKSLHAGGYNMLDLDAVDRELRGHGISQGGQLKGGQKVRYAQWLGAQRLMFGHITEFEEIMLGAYGKRQVGGKLSLWETGTKSFLWEANEPVVRESAAVDKGEAGARFAGQLLRGLFERIISRPLGAESVLFIQRNIETLPLKL